MAPLPARDAPGAGASTTSGRSSRCPTGSPSGSGCTTSTCCPPPRRTGGSATSDRTCSAPRGTRTRRAATTEILRRLQADPDRELGAALLDQRVACGVGNLYKAEICFLLRVSPWTRVGDLSETQARDAVAWSRKLLLRNAWRPEQSTTGDLGEGAQHWVFERGGRACRRCRDVVTMAGQDDGTRRRPRTASPTSARPASPARTPSCPRGGVGGRSSRRAGARGTAERARLPCRAVPTTGPTVPASWSGVACRASDVRHAHGQGRAASSGRRMCVTRTVRRAGLSPRRPCASRARRGGLQPRDDRRAPSRSLFVRGGPSVGTGGRRELSSAAAARTAGSGQARAAPAGSARPRAAPG